MPNLASRTMARGARQFVVQLAFETVLPRGGQAGIVHPMTQV